jgi:hypothetical protein
VGSLSFPNRLVQSAILQWRVRTFPRSPSPSIRSSFRVAFLPQSPSCSRQAPRSEIRAGAVLRPGGRVGSVGACNSRFWKLRSWHSCECLFRTVVEVHLVLTVLRLLRDPFPVGLLADLVLSPGNSSGVPICPTSSLWWGAAVRVPPCDHADLTCVNCVRFSLHRGWSARSQGH